MSSEENYDEWKESIREDMEKEPYTVGYYVKLYQLVGEALFALPDVDEMTDEQKEEIPDEDKWLLQAASHALLAAMDAVAGLVEVANERDLQESIEDVQ